MLSYTQNGEYCFSRRTREYIGDIVGGDEYERMITPRTKIANP
jgi:hypothetical protein